MKNFKKIISLLLVASLCIGVAACSDSGSRKSKKHSKHERDDSDKKKKSKKKLSVEEYSFDDFEDFIDDYTDGEYFTRDYGDCKGVLSEYDHIVVNYRYYDDEDDAADYFDIAYSGFQDDFGDDIFDGTYDMTKKDDYGFVVLSGEGKDDGAWIFDGQYFYGGVYFSGKMVVTVITVDDSSKARSQVDDILEELEFPTP